MHIKCLFIYSLARSLACLLVHARWSPLQVVCSTTGSYDWLAMTMGRDLQHIWEASKPHGCHPDVC